MPVCSKGAAARSYASRGLSAVGSNIGRLVKKPWQYASSYWYGAAPAVTASPTITEQALRSNSDATDPDSDDGGTGSVSSLGSLDKAEDIWAEQQPQPQSSPIEVAKFEDVDLNTPKATGSETVEAACSERAWVQNGYGPAYQYPTPVPLKRGELMGRFEVRC